MKFQRSNRTDAHYFDNENSFGIKKGDFVKIRVPLTEVNVYNAVGRVVGRVSAPACADGSPAIKNWIEVLVLTQTLTAATIMWVEPSCVETTVPVKVVRQLMEAMLVDDKDWTPEKIFE